MEKSSKMLFEMARKNLLQQSLQATVAPQWHFIKKKLSKILKGLLFTFVVVDFESGDGFDNILCRSKQHNGSSLDRTLPLVLTDWKQVCEYLGSNERFDHSFNFGKTFLV